MAIKNYYKILSISENATKREILSAFRKLAKKYHPDLNKSPDAGRLFRDIYEAYELLSDDSKRKQYDAFLMYEGQNQGSSKAKENVNYGGTSGANKQSYNQYSEWTTSAKRNAETYSNLTYKDFTKVVFKKIKKFSIEFFKGLLDLFFELLKQGIIMILTFILIIAIFCIIIMIPILSFKTNIVLGVISTLFSIVSLFIYLKVQISKKSLLDYFLKKSKNRRLYFRVLLSYLSYCILVVILYYTSLYVEEIKVGRLHESMVAGLLTNKDTLLATYPPIDSKDAISSFLFGLDKYKKGFRAFSAKIVVMDHDNKDFDNLHYSVPDNLRAKWIEEVNTIIQIDREEEVVGRYTYGASAIQRICNIKVIDFKSQIILYTEQFRGSLPIDSRDKRSSPGYGTRPDNSVQNFILDYCSERHIYYTNFFDGTVAVNEIKINSDSIIFDVDGNKYNTINIGNQIWMKENLKTTKLNDGRRIYNLKDSSAWRKTTIPALCYYNNDTLYKNIYGALYNFYAVNTEKLCPVGWHVPSNEDWETLSKYLGGDEVAGYKLKESGTLNWKSPNNGATNENKFSGLPGGLRSSDGLFDFINEGGYWRSSIGRGLQDPQIWGIGHLYGDLSTFDEDNSYGFSVRCIKNY